MRRETACCSMYSDMSKRMRFLSLSNNCMARAFASSVLPTPVGPAKRKEPVGWCRRESFAALRSTARATASTASSWPTTLPFSSASNSSSFAFSPWESLATGMPVHLATTSAMCSGVTCSTSIGEVCVRSYSAFSFSNLRILSITPGIASKRKSAAASTSCLASITSSFCLRSWSRCLEVCSSSCSRRSASYCALSGANSSRAFASSAFAS
mmetsp:Transcript_28424/g.65956  ORF Transcript_28424/g.65956 Transcript_28424/m.65956 type:complete len:211 (+) Transcript_28424:758-1390(+)